MQDLGSVLLAQLTAVRDEQPALVSCLAFGRAWYHGVDLGGRSLADLVAGSSTVTDRKEPAHYKKTRNTQSRFVCQRTKTAQSSHNNTSVSSSRSRAINQSYRLQ